MYDVGYPDMVYYVIRLMFRFLFTLRLINPYMNNGLFHPYGLNESISKFRGVWCIFQF